MKNYSSIDKNINGVLTKCCRFVDMFINDLKHYDDYIDILVDYSLIRYPFISAIAYIIRCRNMQQDECNNILYTNIVEITMIVDVLYKNSNSIDMERDVVALRINCGDAWLEYGYTITTSTLGVVKKWVLVCNNRKVVLDNAFTTICNIVHNLVIEIVKKIKIIAENEGLI